MSVSTVAAPELPIPLYLDGANADEYNASLELAADHTYRFKYSFTSIAGPRPGGRSDSGRWTFDAKRSLVVLHPDDPSRTATEVPLRLGLRISARVELGSHGFPVQLSSRQVTLGRLLAASPPVPTRRFLFQLQTADGHWVVVEDRGTPGPLDIPLHVDALAAGRFETFRLEVVDETHCALRTADGHYLTATSGGGIGGPNDASSPIHTDQTDDSDPASLFRLHLDRKSMRAALQVEPSMRGVPQRYVTAVGGGGIHGPEGAAIRTDATVRGRFETFSCIFSFDSE